MNRVLEIPKALAAKGDLVIISRKEYQTLRERAVPTYYLKGSAAKKLDSLVESGIKAYRNGKTKVLKSLADLD